MELQRQQRHQEPHQHRFQSSSLRQHLFRCRYLYLSQIRTRCRRLKLEQQHQMRQQD